MTSRRWALAMPVLAAIRAKCLDCSGGNRAEVADCLVRSCPLWPFRSGANPGGPAVCARRSRPAEAPVGRKSRTIPAPGATSEAAWTRRSVMTTATDLPEVGQLRARNRELREGVADLPREIEDLRDRLNEPRFLATYDLPSDVLQALVPACPDGLPGAGNARPADRAARATSWSRAT